MGEHNLPPIQPEIRFDDRFILLEVEVAPGEPPQLACLVPEAIIGIFPHPDGGSTLVVPGQAFGRFINQPHEIRGAIGGVMQKMMENRMMNGPSVVPVQKRLIHM